MRLYDPPPENTYGFRKCCEAVKAAVPIEVIARRYTDLKPLGGRAWFNGCCALPDHDDQVPSFYIYPPGRFHCYGCDRRGDVIDLEFLCGGYSGLWEAMIALKEEFGVELPGRPETWQRRHARWCDAKGSSSIWSSPVQSSTSRTLMSGVHPSSGPGRYGSRGCGGSDNESGGDR